MAAQHSTCADAVVQQCVSAGLSVCFANPGTTEMHLVAALEQQLSIRSVLCLHEAVCTGACDGYARISGHPAAALLHLGPGLGNGLCNLHNAHRAHSPVLVLVGDHAVWHKPADPVLAQDICALANTVSGRVYSIDRAESTVPVMQAALSALAAGPPAMCNNSTAVGDGSRSSMPPSSMEDQAAGAGCHDSKVVTVILPHDISWTPAVAQQSTANMSSSHAAAGLVARATQQCSSDVQPGSQTLSPGARRFLSDCAAALQAVPRGKAALMLGGAALMRDGDALLNAGRIAAALGAALLCDALPSCISRGAGLPHCSRLPYFPQEAQAELSKYEVLLLLDIRRPVANFGYKGGPSQLLTQPDDSVWELDVGLPVSQALELLAQMVPGASSIRPCLNCAGKFASSGVPPLPVGRLTACALCQAVAALQPPGTILVDESLTSGTAYWEASKGCEAFDHLCLTGGAIGSGPPMSVGAALAAPERQVINLQADGSALYTLQALWTQAREKLKVLTVICANNSYAILKIEAMRQRTGQLANSLTSLEGPAIDWVALGAGMGVPGGRADNCEQLVQLIRQGLQQQGPFLVHAALVAS